MDKIIDTLKNKYSKKEFDSLVKTCDSATKLIQILVDDCVSDIELPDIIKLLYWVTVRNELKQEEQDIIDLIKAHGAIT